MYYKNKQLLSRLIFLGAFTLVVLGIFWMGSSLSDSQKKVSAETVPGYFLPAEKGKAVLVEFSDFQCPACRMYYPWVKQLKTEFGDNLKVVYKYFPLRNIHKNADLSARAGEAAGLQGKFSEMEEVLFTKQGEWDDSGEALSLFRAYASETGLDMEKFNSDINSGPVYDRVNADYQEGVGLGVRGTPTFFLNGKKIINPGSYEEFSKLITQSLEQ